MKSRGFVVIFAALICVVDSFLFTNDRYNSSSVEVKEVWCRNAAENFSLMVIVLAIAPSVINLCTVVVIIFTVVHVKQLKSVTEAVSSSAHWLIRTSVRVGLGPTANRALLVYARKQGYTNLIPRPSVKESNASSRSTRTQ